ncbi:hypothetical protein [Parendozoicomonas sp. Alg238-R29]|uniref:hypothetical protein n=1 Tax=Parendozoicomonas sp. Alg238-R29 TaxID=2993446 RepID=UPI00248EFC3E|nr:hypothetical protein [Parendozoicomonas sp. Alg238-R29]
MYTITTADNQVFTGNGSQVIRGFDVGRSYFNIMTGIQCQRIGGNAGSVTNFCTNIGTGTAELFVAVRLLNHRFMDNVTGEGIQRHPATIDMAAPVHQVSGCREGRASGILGNIDVIGQ